MFVCSYGAAPKGALPLPAPYLPHQNPGILKYGDIPHEYWNIECA